jgi:CcmD family protein
MKRIGILVVTLLLLTAPAFTQQPAPATPAAAQDGFIPVDSPINPDDAMPAPRLVAIAYGFIWVVLFGYLWSVRSRLATVERELETIGRRVASGRKQP